MSITINGADFTQNNNLYNFRDKKQAVNFYILQMLNRTSRIFEYENLPETIPQHYLEMYLQVNGFAAFAKHNDGLYIYFGGLGGEPDEYYYPTLFTVSNPAQNYSANLKINEDCIIMKNDTMQIGMLPMYSRYATQLVENDISIDMASRNMRAAFMITAPDDRTKRAAEKFLQDIQNGESSAVADNAFLEGIKVQPMIGSGIKSLTDLIELQQYCKASWYNEIGLNANYNMKREALSMIESQMNFDALLPLVDDMFRCRQDALQKVNALFGTDIAVHFASSWKKIQNESELSAHSENEIGVTENETE